MPYSEREELLGLTRQAENMRKSYTPWKAAAVEEQAEELRERLAYYADLQKYIVDVAADRVAASLTWAEVTRQTDDTFHRVSSFASVLFARDLITPSQFAEIVEKLQFIPNVTRAARQASADEDKALNAALEDVLNAAGRVSLVNRDAARYEYNKIEGFRTWEKLNSWVKKCVELGLLPKTYVLGVRPGNTLQKMLHPHENKELKAGANK